MVRAAHARFAVVRSRLSQLAMPSPGDRTVDLAELGLSPAARIELRNRLSARLSISERQGEKQPAGSMPWADVDDEEFAGSTYSNKRWADVDDDPD